MSREITQQPADTTMERRLEVVILRDLDDLFNLREGEFVGTTRGYFYRSSDDELSLIGRYGSDVVKVIITDNCPPLFNGLIQIGPINHLSDITKYNADKYLKSNGL